MPKRFQFTLRVLLGLLTLAAVVVWGTTVVGVANLVIVLLLMSPIIVGALVRKPAQGCLVNAFLIVVLIFGGFVVAGIVGLLDKLH